jgi:hypothetical protein
MMCCSGVGQTGKRSASLVMIGGNRVKSAFRVANIFISVEYLDG